MLVAERYRLHGSIGRGGMGEVWQATDEVLGREVAVKLLLGDEADSAAAARFRLEAQTAARLSHPYVVAVFDFGAWDDRFYLVMELVEGQSLAQELTAAGSLGTERVATVAAQAAAGLAAAHREGIVHRDIKPGNLLSDPQGTVKIGDFGIARFVDDPASALTTAGQIVGTSLYLAPERALGRPASAASDVYSLGCVLYQLLTGRPPFHAESATVTLHQHIDMAPVPPRERGVQLPPAFENYLLGLLAKQPEDRPTAQEVADWFGTGAWRGLAEPLPVASDTRSASLSAAPPYASRPPQPGSAETGPPTMYRLPSTAPQPAQPARSAHQARATHGGHATHAGHAANSAHSSHSSHSTPSRRARSGGARAGAATRTGGGVGAMARRRPRVFGILAGAVLFVLAVLAGMKMFSPDTTATETGNGLKDGSSSTGPESTGVPAAGTVARTGAPGSTPAPGVNAEPPASPSFTETAADTPSPAETEEEKAKEEQKEQKEQAPPKQEEQPQPPPQYGDGDDDDDDGGYGDD